MFKKTEQTLVKTLWLDKSGHRENTNKHHCSVPLHSELNTMY